MTQEPANTRDRLLEAACDLFAEKGFDGVTVAEICRDAKANIAAVNYHFGGKEALYREAWQFAHQRMAKLFPPDGGVGPGAPPERRLEARIRAMMRRALSDKRGQEFRIMSHEIAHPTGLLNQIIHDTIRPLGQAMDRIIAELLGGAADPVTVRLCIVSVIGPCMQVMHRQRMHVRQDQPPWFTADMLDRMVEHFTAFAMAGIAEVRRRLQETPAAKPADKEMRGMP